MATRKTKAEAKKVWDSFHKFNPGLQFTIEFATGKYVEGESIHILQVLKCKSCGSEIKTHAVGQHSGTCHICTEKQIRQTASRAKAMKVSQRARERAMAAHENLFGFEEF